jgi:LPS-assembly lipoprotein
MWWADRLSTSALFAAGAFLLTGCGFAPLYADHADTTDVELATVEVDQISDHLGVVLTDHLRDGFTPAGDASPVYRLHVELNEDAVGLSFRSDGTIAQTQLNLTGTWTLQRLSDHKVIGTGTSLGTTFYDDMPDAYANTTAKDTGELRAVDQLSDDIHARIALLLKAQEQAS